MALIKHIRGVNEDMYSIDYKEYITFCFYNDGYNSYGNVHEIFLN